MKLQIALILALALTAFVQAEFKIDNDILTNVAETNGQYYINFEGLIFWLLVSDPLKPKASPTKSLDSSIELSVVVTTFVEERLNNATIATMATIARIPYECPFCILITYFN